MGESKLSNEVVVRDRVAVTVPKMEVTRSRYRQSEFLDFPEVPLSVNTVKRGLKSFFPNFLVRWFLTLVRFVRIFFATVTFGVGSLYFKIRYAANKKKRDKATAQFFAQRFNKLGGAFIKIGQQLALRRDILPDVFCEELEQLHDNVKAFSFDYTKRQLVELVNRPEASSFFTKDKKGLVGLEDIFRRIDPNPIGRASIACVYKAQLVDGDWVAIKVKRPHIERIFATDIFAMSIFLRILEFLNVMKTGVTHNLQSEIREMFTEELNFNIEKRYQDLFRQLMKKNKRFRVTAPRIYFRLSSESVITSEFLQNNEDGIFMSTLLHLKKKNKEAFHAKLDELNINPKKVARRLIRFNHFSFYEMPFFHGDPHPGNVFLRPNNKIVLIDFGSCGSFGDKERNLMRMMQFYYTRGDVAGMTQCVVSLMEPLPPIDVHAFTKALEAEWWQGYYGIISKNAHWTEKTSFRLWMALFTISNRYNVPVPLHMLRMVRATLAYDTVAAGLYTELNVFKEYQVYFDRYAERLRCETNEDIVRQLFFGPDPINYVRLKRVFDLGEEAVFRLQQLVRTPIPNIASLSDKVFDVIRFLFQYLKYVVVVLGLGIGMVFLTVDKSGTKNEEAYKVLKAHWDEILVGAINPINWTDRDFLNDISYDSTQISSGKEVKCSNGETLEQGTDLRSAFCPNTAYRISMVMLITMVAVAVLTWIYIQKILSRLKDLDGRN